MSAAGQSYDDPAFPRPGVSRELAAQRSAVISDIHYDLQFSIPRERSEPIAGRILATFLLDRPGPVVFDFAQPAERVSAVRVGGEASSFEARNEHIVVPVDGSGDRRVAVEIDFFAGDGSLNRQDDYLYTLFVPDRARTAFPVFDQPDLKARFLLKLEIPAGWRAVANGSVALRQVSGERARLTFTETAPLSSYLFSFAVGDFEVEERVRGGRRMAMYHRETDAALVERNVDAIFDLHASSLEWLEAYTGIPYPFEKFDFALIPSFQYGGMEHPGAILYRAEHLFLAESATQDAQLGRASVIAHETAHQWFGDLVTMEWFDDVWMKETFANYLAAKIVNPAFPEVDHDLRFFLAHYPAAYAVDRTAGANPVQQPLDNLEEAGTLYGAIIYQKAPIVVSQLERLIGEEAVRRGLREYLATHAYGNATWSDLIGVLDALTPEDLRQWSQVWVEQSGRPRVDVAVVSEDGIVVSATLRQSDVRREDRLWNQQLDLVFGYRDGSSDVVPVQLRETAVSVPELRGRPTPDYVLVEGYGFMAVDTRTRDYLMTALPSIDSASTRAAAWVSLWETMLEGGGEDADTVTRVDPGAFVRLAREALFVETDELNVQRILNYLSLAYWRYLRPEERLQHAAAVEAVVWDRLVASDRSTLASAYFEAYRDLALTPSAVERLQRIWAEEETVPGVPLSESDFIALAQGLALRDGIDALAVLSAQRDRIESADRRAQFDFVSPALSPARDTRDAFFASLSDSHQRAREPWVLSALGFLHHPLRAVQSEQYIEPSLDLLEEIQRTGDIFFPERWLRTTLGGHQTSRALATVQQFLAARSDLSFRLRAKLLQAADGLVRASRLTGSGWRSGATDRVIQRQ